MVIGIHNRNNSYSKRWIEYCKENSIQYKIVNCYDNNVFHQLEECDALLWHYYQEDYRDLLFAKQLLYALEHSGKIVFPNFATGWHFDDKVGQKYLFEGFDIQTPSTEIFYHPKDALDWAIKAEYPKVQKLRGGASSRNVRLVKNKRSAKRYIKRAFGKGFPQFNRWGNFTNRIILYQNNKETFWGVIKGFLRLFVPVELEKRRGPEKSYIYFQEFIKNEGFDYRIEIVGEYCIAMIRKVRKGDFRASGGHDDHYEKELIPKDVIEFAFEINDKIKAQSIALDIIRSRENKKLYLVEISYCYSLDEDEFSHGYWDRNGNWYNKKFDSRDWMIESVIKEIEEKRKNGMGTTL